MNETFLEGRTAVVTGATRGIGFAIAHTLAEAGATVAICGRSQAGVDDAVMRLTNGSQRKVVGKAADVRASTDVAALFAWVDSETGGPDILVNNAGLGVMKSTAELTVQDWQQTIETNLSGAFYCAREALNRFKNRGGGYIINIGSLAGKNAFAGGGAYNASKFGLYGFTEAMMLDSRYDNVRVSHIMPGSVDTEFSAGSAMADLKAGPARADLKTDSATADWKTGSARADWKIAPEDIGEIVLMLLRMPERTLVSQVEVRPAKPRK
ncbi:MAG: SDR family NAD(P)-dependent oxidoreductase [Bryobacteraceae bacterium]